MVQRRLDGEGVLTGSGLGAIAQQIVTLHVPARVIEKLVDPPVRDGLVEQGLEKV